MILHANLASGSLHSSRSISTRRCSSNLSLGTSCQASSCQWFSSNGSEWWSNESCSRSSNVTWRQSSSTSQVTCEQSRTISTKYCKQQPCLVSTRTKSTCYASRLKP